MAGNIQNILNRVAPVFCIVASIVFIIGGVIGLHQVATFSPATGTIESIEIEQGTADESDSYTVIVSYNANGTIYYADLGQLQNGFYEGKEIDILYNPDDFSQITLPSKTGPIIGIAFGAVMLLAGIFMTIRRIAYGRA